MPEPVYVPAYVPALHTSFPPPRQPRTVPLPARPGLGGGAVAEVAIGHGPPQAPAVPSGRVQVQEARAYPRLRTPSMPSVVLRQGSAPPVHATLRDISCSGAGLARRGSLRLAPGTVLRLEIHEPGSDRRHAITGHVRWSRFGGVNTYLGVHFDSLLAPEHPLLLSLASAVASTTPP